LGILFNSVDGYGGTLTPAAVNPPSGLSANCSSFTLLVNAVGQPEQCNLASSTPGIYFVNITVTDGSLTHWTVLTVIVTTFTTPTLVFQTNDDGGIAASLTSSFYVDNTNFSLIGITTVSATNSAGTVYTKTKTTDLSGLKANFIDVISSSPYWLAIACTVDGLARSEDCNQGPNQGPLYRTPDINHDGKLNIVDLALVASHFDNNCSSGACDFNYNAGFAFSTVSCNCKLSLDLNADYTINIFDLILIAKSFGASVFQP